MHHGTKSDEEEEEDEQEDEQDEGIDNTEHIDIKKNKLNFIQVLETNVIDTTLCGDTDTLE